MLTPLQKIYLDNYYDRVYVSPRNKMYILSNNIRCLFSKVDSIRGSSSCPQLGSAACPCLSPGSRGWSSSVSWASLALDNLRLGPVAASIITDLLGHALAHSLRSLLKNIYLLSSSSTAGTLDSVLLKGLNLSSWYIWCYYLGHGTALLLGDGPALLGHGVHVLGLPHRVLLSPAAGGRHWGRGGDRHWHGVNYFKRQRHFLECWLIFFIKLRVLSNLQLNS